MHIDRERTKNSWTKNSWKEFFQKFQVLFKELSICIAWFKDLKHNMKEN